MNRHLWTGKLWMAGVLGAAIGALTLGGCTAAPGGSGDDDGNNNVGGVAKITTVVGTGVPGNNGDGLDALESQVYFPVDMAFSPDGALFTVDWNNHRIRRLNPDNTLETIVGTGELTGELQEEGIAKEAKLNHPTNIFFEPDGNFLVAAWHNSQVTRVTLNQEGVAEVMNIVIAGVGGRTFGGDGGPAKQANFNLPSSIVEDSQGNIIIADQANQRIRRIEKNTGIVTTICNDAGPNPEDQAVGGFNGDDIPAVQAQIKLPAGQSSAPSGRLAIDGFDNLYLADTENHRIRMIDSLGIIHTIVGTGERGFSGDGGDPKQAMLDTPSDVWVNPEGTILYIADTYNNRIRMVDLVADVITTIVGSGLTPEDADGDGFFSEAEIGDGSAAIEARLNRPYGVAVAPNGDIYVADTYNSRIRKVTTSEVPPPIDQGDGFKDVEVIPCTDEIGSICTYAGIGQKGFNGDGKDRTQTSLYWPLDIEFMPSGKIFVNDWNNHKFREILPDGTFRTVMGSNFIGDGAPDFSDLYTIPGDPLGTTVNLNHITDQLELPNGLIAITVWHNHKIRLYDPVTGNVRVALGDYPTFVDNAPAYEARANLPSHSVLDSKGNLIFIDQKNWRIRVAENFAEDLELANVRTIAGNGTHAVYVDGTPLAEASFGWPGGPNPEPTSGLVIESDLVFYFGENESSSLFRLEFFDEQWSDGVITRIAGTGETGYNGDGPALETQLNWPQDIELGPDGNLYFNDTNNFIVRRLNLETGMIETVAGNGTKGYSGDGGPALEASFDRAFGVAFDAEGDLYISDTFNGRIRKVNLNLASPATE